MSDDASSADEEYTFDDSSPPPPPPAKKKKKKNPAENKHVENKESVAAEAAAKAASNSRGNKSKPSFESDDDDDNAPLSKLSKRKNVQKLAKEPPGAERKRQEKKLNRDNAWESDEEGGESDNYVDQKPKAKKPITATATAAAKVAAASSSNQSAKKRKNGVDGDRPPSSTKTKKVKKEDGVGAVSSSSASGPVNGNKRKKIKTGASAAPSPVASNAAVGNGNAPNKALKKLDKSERLQFAMQSFLWWNAQEPPAGCQWSKLEHAGVSFPDPYQPHRIPLLYEGKPLALTPAQEEAATFFAAMDPDGMHLGKTRRWRQTARSRAASLAPVLADLVPQTFSSLLSFRSSSACQAIRKRQKSSSATGSTTLRRCWGRAIPSETLLSSISGRSDLI